MCDYSLMAMESRLARDGEELVAHRFNSGSMGLVSLPEYQSWKVGAAEGFWRKILDSFSFQPHPATVVCVPPGAQLRVHDFRADDTATFTQLSLEVNRHRDALRFSDGQTILVQMLEEGQRVTVLQIAERETVEQGDVQPVLVRALW